MVWFWRQPPLSHFHTGATLLDYDNTGTVLFTSNDGKPGIIQSQFLLCGAGI